MLEDLDLIIDAVPYGISIMDDTGKIIRVNPGLSRVTGLSSGLFIGQPVTSLYERGHFLHMPIAYKALKTGVTHEGIQQVSSGKSVLATATPVLDRSGFLRYIVVDARDVAESSNQPSVDHDGTCTDQLLQGEPALQGLHYSSDTPFVARSSSMQSVLTMAKRVAVTDATVLLLGETGVGKDVVARIIHEVSLRHHQGSFVRINCNTMPRDLIETELWGYVRGAFTGASSYGKPGLLEVSSGGTLFLDEVGDLPLEVQGKFLDVLENGTFRRLGSCKEIHVAVRIIAASNQNLLELVDRGRFRRDLYYRLSVIHIQIPPLRNRPEDIVALVGYYLRQFNEKYATNKQVSPELLELLQTYRWPGNVRELVHLVERLVITSPRELMGSQDFLPPDSISCSTQAVSPLPPSLKQALEEIERNILASGKRQHGSSRRMAKALGISHTAVLKKLRKFGLDQ